MSAIDIKKGQLIRDSEIESALKDFIYPIFKVAGLDSKKLQIYLIVDPDINAAATLGSSIIIHTGLITKTDHVGQVIGVFAHETGHIADGHVVRTIGFIQKAQMSSMILSALLGTAIGVATGRPDAGLGVFLGGMEAGQQSFLIYSRGQESSADQAAIKYMDQLGYSSQGIMEIMETFTQQDLLSSAHQPAYMRTHPLSRERLDFFRHHLATSPYSHTPFPLKTQQEYARIKIKIEAFLHPPEQILAKYTQTDSTLTARYARAIALFRNNQLSEALQTIDDLIKEHPKDPYFYELKGQMLFESGKVEAALPAYRTAVQLAPHPSLIRLLLAHVLIELNKSQYNREAIKQLELAKKTEEDSTMLWRLLAVAYGREQRKDLAELMLAEQASREGRTGYAKRHAEKALKDLPQSDRAARQRAQDILNDIQENHA